MCKNTTCKNSDLQYPEPNENDNFVYSQLHEQFAENYNSISNYVIALMVGLVTVLTCYGISCRDLFVTDPESQLEPWYAPLLLFLGSNILVVGFFLIVSYLSIKQGWAIRRDQFIIHAIRCKVLGKDKMLTRNGGIFHEEYQPFGKFSTKKEKEKEPDSNEKKDPDSNEKRGEQQKNKNKKKRKSDILVGTFQYIYNISLCTIITIMICTTIVIIVYISNSTELNFFVFKPQPILGSSFCIHFGCLNWIYGNFTIWNHQLCISCGLLKSLGMILAPIAGIIVYLIFTRKWLNKICTDYTKYIKAYSKFKISEKKDDNSNIMN